MPSSEQILVGLTTVANQWWALAVAWHVWVGAWLIAISIRRELSNRLLSAALMLPLLSVSVLAWTAMNPFNGAVFAALSLLLGSIAYRMPRGPVEIGSWPVVLAGGTLVAFGWTYPHFLETRHWAVYLIAAPLGLLPCPTLATISGLTLIVGGLRSTAWQLTVALVCLVYATIGIFRLGVLLDVGLFAGAAALACLWAANAERTAVAFARLAPGSHQHD